MNARLSTLPLTTCTVDLDRRTAVRDGERLRMSSLEAALLGHLAMRPGATVSREELLVQVWGYRPGVFSRAVDTAMGRLRAKLERDPAEPDHLFTERGSGYRFVPLTDGLALVDPEPTASLDSGVPRPATALIGRVEELAELRERLQHGRLVTLRGPGGAGKTRLAVAIGAAWSGGALFVDLTSARSPEGAVRLVAAALELGGTKDPLAAAGRALRGQGVDLLILDNCEQIEGLAAPLGAWFAAAPELRVLATSRRSVGSIAESLVVVGPMAREDATALFLERALAAGRSAPIPRDEHLDGLIDDLEGLPLAIELAAGRSAILSPKQLRARLQQRFRLLAGGKSAVDRHRALSATLEWSWELLGESERTALMELAVFVRPFTLAAAAAVLGVDDDLDALDLVEALVEASLVRTAVGPGREPRFALFVSVRDFAEGKHDAGGRSAAERRHGVYWAEEGERLWKAYRLGPAPARRAALRAAIDDIVAALDRLEEHDAELALQAGLVACGYLEATASRADWADLAVRCRRLATPERSVELRVGALVFESRRLKRDRVSAEAAAEEALAAADAANRPSLRSRGLRAVCAVQAFHGAHRAAWATAREAAEVASKGEDVRELRAARRTLALWASTNAPLDEALAVTEAVLAEEAARGDSYGEAAALRTLAAALIRAGRFAEAVDAARRSHEVSKLVGDVRAEARAAMRLAEFLYAVGECPETADVAAKATAGFLRLGEEQLARIGELFGAMAWVGVGDLEASDALLDSPLSRRVPPDAAPVRITGPFARAHRALAEPALPEARRWLNQVLEILRPLPWAGDTARANLAVGLIDLAEGDEAGMEARFAEAAEVLASNPDPRALPLVTLAIAAARREFVTSGAPASSSPGARTSGELLVALAQLRSGAAPTAAGDDPRSVAARVAAQAQQDYLALAAWHALRCELARVDVRT